MPSVYLLLIVKFFDFAGLENGNIIIYYNYNYTNLIIT